MLLASALRRIGWTYYLMSAGSEWPAFHELLASNSIIPIGQVHHPAWHSASMLTWINAVLYMLLKAMYVVSE